MRKHKVCMLGAFAVGKTSLVERFVHSIFDEKYLTTVGVKVDKKSLVIDGEEVVLVLWDLAGEDEFQRLRMSYLRGSSGLLYVVDATRASTLEKALDIADRAERELGRVPSVVAVNKCDLASDRDLDARSLETLERRWPGKVIETSAKTSIGVEEIFRRLALAIAEEREGGTA